MGTTRPKDLAVGEQSNVRLLQARVSELEQRLNDRANRRRRFVERDQLFSTFLDNINEVIWMLDRRTNQLLYVSPAFERVWGRELKSLYESPLVWQEAIHHEDHGRVSARFAEIWEADSYAEEYRILRPDGAMRWIWDRSFPVRGADGQTAYMIGIAEDITTRKQAERDARRSERLASIGTLAAGIAHEINNPIGAILLAAEFARDNETNPRTIEALTDIASEAARCGDIVQSVLQFAREETAEKLPGDINDAIRRASALVNSYAEEWNGTLELALGEDLPRVSFNETEITQVIVNLVRNGFEAGSSTVEIQTRQNADGSISVWIRDDGPGVKPEAVKNLFDPFFTTRRDKGGTGLGLSITHGIVTEHKGTIEVATQLGAGTTMKITLPSSRTTDTGE